MIMFRDQKHLVKVRKMVSPHVMDAMEVFRLTVKTGASLPNGGFSEDANKISRYCLTVLYSPNMINMRNFALKCVYSTNKLSGINN